MFPYVAVECMLRGSALCNYVNKKKFCGIRIIQLCRWTHAMKDDDDEEEEEEEEEESEESESHNFWINYTCLC